MMEGWKEYLFDEFVECNPKIGIKRGETVEHCEMEDINPVFKYLYPQGKKIYNGSNSKFQNGDTVFARITPCLENGKIAQIKGLTTDKAIGSTEFFVFRGKKEVSISDFVYYLCKTNIVRDTAVNSMTGASGRQRADLKALKKLSLHCPQDISIQQKIASILAAYDELIEVNNQQIALLEEEARELYKEWFVRMRFPGYKSVKFVNGVPEGWKYVTLDSFVQIKMGQSPQSKFYNENRRGLPFHQGVGSYGKRFPNHIVYTTFNGKVAEKGNILFSVRAPVGRLNIADRKIIIGRGLAAMHHCQNLNSYLFYFLDNEFSYEDKIGNGAIFNAVGRDELFKYKVLMNHEVARVFDDIVKKLDNQIEYLSVQNQHLVEIRDRLLPRLMSGKLSIKG